MNKGVIFDLDGTLVDSVYDINDSLNKMLSNNSYPLITVERVREIIGYGAKKLVKDAILKNIEDKTLDRLLCEYNNIYTHCGSPKTVVYDGVIDVLNQLKKRNYKLAVCTNKPQETANEVIEIYFSGIFDMVVGGKENAPLKPNKEAVMPIISKLNLNIEKTYFVGDMQTDCTLSRNANLNNVSVLWGYGKEEDLLKLGVKTFAKEPVELLTIIK